MRSRLAATGCPDAPQLPQLALCLFTHSYYLQHSTRWKFHTANVSRHSVREMWMCACIRVIASELISHDKLILREAPVAAQSECHLCCHGLALSSLCAEPDNAGGAGGKKKSLRIAAKCPEIWWPRSVCQTFIPLGGRVRNLPYVRVNSRREESVPWAALVKLLASVYVRNYTARLTSLFKCWRSETI